MSEHKFIVGRFFNLIMPQSGMVPVLGNFMRQNPILMTIQESTGMLTKKSNVVVGPPSLKAHRNFQWLHWVPGAICEVIDNNVDVLTGPMSGCWMTRYQRNGECIGHVGTSDDPQKTLAAKAGWNAFARANPLQIIGGFKPEWPRGNSNLWKAGDGLTPRTFGLLSNSIFYTVFTYPQVTPAGLTIPGLHRIAGVKLEISAHIVQIQNI